MADRQRSGRRNRQATAVTTPGSRRDGLRLFRDRLCSLAIFIKFTGINPEQRKVSLTGCTIFFQVIGINALFLLCFRCI
jgi:hypothetical protein